MFRAILNYLILSIIYIYRVLISPFTPPACRFHPTCSEYSQEAFKRHGVLKGLFLSIRRILRCNPWGGYGIDLVPEKEDKKTSKKTS